MKKSIISYLPFFKGTDHGLYTIRELVTYSKSFTIIMKLGNLSRLVEISIFNEHLPKIMKNVVQGILT